VFTADVLWFVIFEVPWLIAWNLCQMIRNSSCFKNCVPEFGHPSHKICQTTFTDHKINVSGMDKIIDIWEMTLHSTV